MEAVFQKQTYHGNDKATKRADMLEGILRQTWGSRCQRIATRLRLELDPKYSSVSHHLKWGKAGGPSSLSHLHGCPAHLTLQPFV